MSSIYVILQNEIKAVDKQLVALQEKRRILAATASLYAPEGDSQEIEPKEPPKLGPSLKERVMGYISQFGPQTVNELVEALSIPHTTSAHRAVSELIRLGHAAKDEETKKVYIKD